MGTPEEHIVKCPHCDEELNGFNVVERDAGKYQFTMLACQSCQKLLSVTVQPLPDSPLFGEAAKV